jgi:hypothetical protein
MDFIRTKKPLVIALIAGRWSREKGGG